MNNPSTSLIDEAYLLMVSGGDYQFCIEILELFEKRTQQDLSDLDDLYHKKLFSDLQSKVHAMRSSFAAIKAQPASAALRLLEDLLTNNSIEELPLVVKKVKDICQRTIGAAQTLQMKFQT
jgi:HPt (histidine-containing phosphotransfer) domain-containing protein